MAEIVNKEELFEELKSGVTHPENRAHIELFILKLFARIDELEEWCITNDICVECGDRVEYCPCNAEDEEDGDEA